MTRKVCVRSSECAAFGSEVECGGRTLGAKCEAECLDHFVVFGETHLRHLLSEYLAYYHPARPHQGLDNRPLGWTESSLAENTGPLGKVVCEVRLGGLLRHYRRAT